MNLKYYLVALSIFSFYQPAMGGGFFKIESACPWIFSKNVVKFDSETAEVHLLNLKDFHENGEKKHRFNV